MHNVRLNLLQLRANGPDAADEKRPHPADLGHIDTVKKDVWGKVGWRSQPRANAGYHMDLDSRDSGQSLQQRFRRRAKVWNLGRVVLERFAIVVRYESDLHAGASFWNARLCPTWRTSRNFV